MTQPKFFVGVFHQKIASFAKHKAMGINLMMPEPSEDPVARRKACADLGMYYIDTMVDVNDTALLNDPYCLAICANDEPSNNAPWFSDTVNFQAFVSAWKAVWYPRLQLAKGKKPIYINVAGGHVVGARPWSNLQEVAPFFEMADIISCDLYPITTDKQNMWTNWNAGIGLPVSLADATKPDPLAVGTTYPEYALKLLKHYFPGKQVWSYLETCCYDTTNQINGRQPTGAELHQECDSMTRQGIGGLIYFIDCLTGPGWSDPLTGDWDGRNAEQMQACTEIAQSLTGTVAVQPPPASVDLKPILDRLAALEAKAITNIVITRG